MIPTTTNHETVSTTALQTKRGNHNQSPLSPLPEEAEEEATPVHEKQTKNSSKKHNKDVPHHVCSQVEFELHVGKAMDTLRKDYQEWFATLKTPDFSIYSPHIQFVDPSGVHVHGLRNYQNAHRLLQTLFQFLYCPQKSSLTSARMCYDPVQGRIRIHWHAQMVPRELFGGTRSRVYLDATSVYDLDRRTGDICQHSLETLLWNNQALRPKEGLVAALQDYHGATVPSFVTGQDSMVSSLSQEEEAMDAPLFQVWFAPFTGHDARQSLFFESQTPAEDQRSGSSTTTTTTTTSSHNPSSSSSGDEGTAAIDWDALDRKNKSRQKFGLQPMTPEEFLNVQARVQALDAAQQLKFQQQQQQQQLAEQQAQQEEQEQTKAGVLEKLLGRVLSSTSPQEDVCESNYDCVRPQVCCDFGFSKRCCTSGSPVLGNQWATVPVPVETPENPHGPNTPPPRW